MLADKRKDQSECVLRLLECVGIQKLSILNHFALACAKLDLTLAISAARQRVGQQLDMGSLWRLGRP